MADIFVMHLRVLFAVVALSCSCGDGKHVKKDKGDGVMGTEGKNLLILYLSLFLLIDVICILYFIHLCRQCSKQALF